MQHKGTKMPESTANKEQEDFQNYLVAKRLNISFDRKLKPIQKFIFPEPIIDPKKYKRDFIKGHGNITGFCELNDSNLTSYQETFKGK